MGDSARAARRAITHSRGVLYLFVGLLGVALVARDARAQAPLDGPPPPIAPATITRDASGQATVRAIHLTSPLKVDGVLDEAVYASEQPFGGLIQVTPDYGKPQTERSDVWVTFDDDYVYVTCRCWDSAPPDEWIANELRRDTGGLRNNDHIGVMFDTFHDKRNGFGFYTNPLGARADYSVVDETIVSTDWNPVWTSKTGRFDGGWTVEMAIPFKSLRFRADSNQVWGIQVRRSIRRKNEWAYLTPVPQVLAGPQALNRVSAAATLVGIRPPSTGHNIELKPYAISRLTTDRVQVPALDNKFGGDVGGDLKYALTPNLTADLTFNTDFAQVEVDEQQVNLTRFNLFFPEKRDFFLEGRGIFEFGQGAGSSFGFGGPSNTPSLFYPRRIGLSGGQVIPITAGGRVTGKAGAYSIGLMNIQTGRETVSQTEPTNFTVVRLKRDVLQRSAIGMIATNRSVAATGVGSNQAYGVDGAFSVGQDLTLGTYWARTVSSDLAKSDDQSYQAKLDYNADRYGVKAEFLSVGDNFRPDVGFTRRTDLNRSFGSLRFSPRPASIPSVRKFSWTASGEYIENGAGHLETRTWSGEFITEFQSSDQFQLETTRNYEVLPVAFTPAGSPVEIAPGPYSFSDVTATYTFGSQRRAAGMVTVQAGGYYNGTIRRVTFGGSPLAPGRIAFSKNLSVEPGFTITRIELPDATFTTRLARARVDFGFSPLMFATALVQYNSADRTLSSNLRFRWEYAPGSELFLVYTDERDRTELRYAAPDQILGLRNRAFVIKVNRLFRF